MNITTTIHRIYMTMQYGRHEAHCGDSVGYSHVSRTDALQSLLSDETHDSRAHHPYDWPERGTPLHAIPSSRGGML